jgi:hypothetical protein
MIVQSLKDKLIEHTFINGEFDFHKLRAKENLEILTALKDSTNFLPESASNAQRAWHIYNETLDYPLCSGNRERKSFISFSSGYKKTCSSESKKRTCVCWSPVLEQTKQTMIERYGVEHALQSSKLKEKARITFTDTYTVFGKDIEEKKRKTCYDRYGVNYVFQSKELRESAKETNLERYGVDHFSKTEEFKQNIQKTSQNRFGVDHFTQSESVIQKKKDTCLERYGGVAPACSEQVMAKVKQTNLEKYGVDTPFKMDGFRERTKEALIEKYRSITSIPSLY